MKREYRTPQKQSPLNRNMNSGNTLFLFQLKLTEFVKQKTVD